MNWYAGTCYLEVFHVRLWAALLLLGLSVTLPQHMTPNRGTAESSNGCLCVQVFVISEVVGFAWQYTKRIPLLCDCIGGVLIPGSALAAALGKTRSTRDVLP